MPTQDDDRPLLSRRIPVNGTILYIPFVVNVREMSSETIEGLLDQFTDTLDAQYFRDKSLYQEVLQDRFDAAKSPRKFLYGPFVGVTVKDDDTLRLSSFDAPQGGFTVYAMDQIQLLLEGLQAAEAPSVTQNRPKG